MLFAKPGRSGAKPMMKEVYALQFQPPLYQ
jgi:hypothetical protein